MVHSPTPPSFSALVVHPVHREDFFFKTYLFTWLPQALVAACGSFVVVYWLHSWGLWP